MIIGKKITSQTLRCKIKTQQPSDGTGMSILDQIKVSKYSYSKVDDAQKYINEKIIDQKYEICPETSQYSKKEIKQIPNKSVENQNIIKSFQGKKQIMPSIGQKSKQSTKSTINLQNIKQNQSSNDTKIKNQAKNIKSSQPKIKEKEKKEKEQSAKSNINHINKVNKNIKRQKQIKRTQSQDQKNIKDEEKQYILKSYNNNLQEQNEFLSLNKVKYMKQCTDDEEQQFRGTHPCPIQKQQSFITEISFSNKIFNNFNEEYQVRQEKEQNQSQSQQEMDLPMYLLKEMQEQDEDHGKNQLIKSQVFNKKYSYVESSSEEGQNEGNNEVQIQNLIDDKMMNMDIFQWNDDEILNKQYFCI